MHNCSRQQQHKCEHTRVNVRVCAHISCQCTDMCTWACVTVPRSQCSSWYVSAHSRVCLWVCMCTRSSERSKSLGKVVGLGPD